MRRRAAFGAGSNAGDPIVVDDDDDDDDAPIVTEAQQAWINAERARRRREREEDEAESRPKLRRLARDADDEDDDEDDEAEDEDGPGPVVAVVRADGRMTRPDGLVDVCEYYRRTRLGEAEVALARERIARDWTVGRSANFEALSRADLEDLFRLYDERFFAGAFQRNFDATGHALDMRPYAALKRSAGRCVYDATGQRRACPYTIEIATGILRDAFGPDRPAAPRYACSGLVCASRLECLQLTLEHEMVHLLMFVWRECNDARPSGRLGGHGKTFKLLARNLFGHTDTKHGLFKALGAGESGSRSERIARARAEVFVGAAVELKGHAYTVVELNAVNFKAVRRDDGQRYRIPYLSAFRVVGAGGAPPAAPSASSASSDAAKRRAAASGAAARRADEVRRCLREGMQVSVTDRRGKTFTGTVVQFNPKTVYARGADGRTVAIPYALISC